MPSLAELRDKLSDLLDDGFATEEEIAAARSALIEAEKQLEKLDEVDLSSSLEPATKEDYHNIAELGKTIGVDAIRTAQLFSDLEMKCKPHHNTKLGMYALRMAVINASLQQTIAEMNSISNCAVTRLNQIYREKKNDDDAKPKRNGKK